MRATEGRAKLHADIAHPIHSAAPELIQSAVVEAYVRSASEARSASTPHPSPLPQGERRPDSEGPSTGSGRTDAGGLRTAVLKGRANYLCLERWAEARLDTTRTWNQSEARLHARISVWLPTTETGELGEIAVPAAERAAWEALSLEEAIPRFGADFGPQTYPQEAGLERTAVSFNKGCYLGQEVICMLEMRGHVKRRLVQLAVVGATPEPGAAIVDGDGAHLGTVTRVGAPAAGETLALGMVKRAFSEPGTEVRIGGGTAKVLRVA